MSVKQAYKAAASASNIQPDAGQQSALEVLQQVYDALHVDIDNASLSVVKEWGRNILGVKHQNQTGGCYLWGDVGRGKTWLMNLFYRQIKRPDKMRMHFHHFMRMIHGNLDEFKGRRDPLKLIAKQLSQQTKIICLDEFHVSDITDAMILHNLLDSLFKLKIILVTTSNIHPAALYKNGLQRERFLPAINLIQTHLKVIELGGPTDYRLTQVDHAEHYLYPDNEANTQRFSDLFLKYSSAEVQRQAVISINNRSIKARMLSGDCAWFDFDDICAGPRATSDYIEIANQYRVVFISHVPALNNSNDDKARRFIHLVDEFYDRNIILVLLAEKPHWDLYCGNRLVMEFQRTASRLDQMRLSVPVSTKPDSHNINMRSVI